MPGNHQKRISYQILGGKAIKKSQNQSTNNGDKGKKAKRDFVSQLVGEGEYVTYLIRNQLTF